MKIHYFQRYHQEENVATANTMLLLSRLYRYSTEKFFDFIKGQFFLDEEFDAELSFALQQGGKGSVPDAIISQPSIKLVVETKLSDWFKEDQLIRHLNKFGDENYTVLITLSPCLMELNKKEMIDKKIKEYNEKNKMHIIHVDTTFEALAQGVQDVLTERDYEMKDLLNDYLDYCRSDNLIQVSYAWKKMRMQLAGTTFDFNVTENVYYDNINRSFSEHDYLALYKKKSVRAVGKLEAIITAIIEDDDIKYDVERGDLTEERKKKILKAIEDGKRYGYNLNANRYFFVDRFYETDFRKITPRPPMGTRMFDLTEVLQTEALPNTEIIAEMLKGKTWS